MNAKQISETAADVAALIPRYSWELMDEEQRDALMEQVVLPRYMETTSDGVKMTPTWWGELVGATSNAVQKRVERLKTKAQTENGSASPSHWTTDPKQQRTARSVLRESSPEQIKQVLADLPASQLDKVASAATDALVGRAKATRAEHSTEPTAGELMGGEKWDPRALAAHVEKWGLVFGSPTVEFIDPTKRRLARSVAIFHVFVDAILSEALDQRILRVLRDVGYVITDTVTRERKDLVA